MSWKDLAEDISFSEHPQICECFMTLHEAFEDFKRECDGCGSLRGDERLVAIFNALIRFHIRQEAAVNVGTGMAVNLAGRKARRDVKKMLIATWSTRDISIAEYRAMAVSIAYRDQVRFSVSGEKDSRMEAALQAAAIIEGLISADAVGTIRKSITRLRQKVQGENLFRLNRDLLQIEFVSADSVMFSGLPGCRGRPPKGN